MKSKQEVIQEAWGYLWDRVYDKVDEHGWVKWTRVPLLKSDDFYNLDLEKRNIKEAVPVKGEWHWRLKEIRPKSLKGIEDNKSWKETGYHHWRGVKLTNSPFENGQYYEIGFMSAHSDDFYNQGIRQYNNGFFDENNYHLKPFPTHFRIVKLSDNPLY